MPRTIAPNERVRPRFGDIFEIATPKGFAYAQYTHKRVEPPRFGALIRVVPGLFRSRPTYFSGLIQQTPRLITFFPLGIATSQKAARIVASLPKPEHAKAFPVFKEQALDTSPWYLWDG